MKHIEHVVLRTLIDFPDAWDQRPTEDLFTGYTREVFELARGLKERGASLDLVALTELADHTDPVQDEIANLSPVATVFSTLEGNIGVLREEAGKRKAREIGADLMESGDREKARVALDELDGRFSTSDTMTAQQAKAAMWSDLSRQSECDVTGLTTGLTDLDAKLGGLEDGDLIVVAGRPSMGKTTLALNIAGHQTVPVAIFSLETTVPKLLRRMVAAKGMDFGKLKRPRTMSDRDWELAQQLTQKVSEGLYINNTGGMSIGALETEARRLVKHKGVRLIVVDYLQLVTCPAERRFEEVSLVSRRLQALAKSLNVPLIAVSQLRRMDQATLNPRPKLSDLRESGQIEQDADIVLLIHRPEYYTASNRPGQADIIVAKNKEGETGDVVTAWQGQFQRFVTIQHEWGREVA